jgi:hypothetical protein
MAYTKRMVRAALVQVLQSQEATCDERIKAARLLTKLLGLAQPPNPRRERDEKKYMRPSSQTIAYRVSWGTD